MSPELSKADRIRLMHMRDAARQAMEFAKARGRDNLSIDAMYRRALVSCIQEIGEAAVAVSEVTRRRIPELPWAQMVRMRNRLVHGYFNINLDLVWEVIVKDLPPLVEALERALQTGE